MINYKTGDRNKDLPFNINLFQNKGLVLSAEPGHYLKIIENLMTANLKMINYFLLKE